MKSRVLTHLWTLLIYEKNEGGAGKNRISSPCLPSLPIWYLRCKQIILNIDAWPVTQLVRASSCQGCRFDPRSGHIKGETNKYINKWNNKSMSLSPPSSLYIINKWKFIKALAYAHCIYSDSVYWVTKHSRKKKQENTRYFRRRNTWIEWPHSEMKAIEKIPKLLVETLVESFHQKGKKKK